MRTDQHWERVYQTRSTTEVSWYRAHLERSLESIRQVAPGLDAAIIDVGAGASTLVDDLIAAGYTNLTVLDISPTALELARNRLGPRADTVHWLAGDVLKIALPLQRFDVWHDRAVFHFLTEAEHRQQYVKQMTSAVRRGGHVLIATFGPEGPLRCSGLEVTRYDAATLAQELSEGFRLVECSIEEHQTPAGVQQQFLHSLFERI